MLLTVVQAVSQASLEIGITQQPVNAAIGSPDQDITQMVALLSAVADEVTDEEPYRGVLGDGYWLLDKDGATKKAVPTADDDKILFDARLAIAGLKFRFLQAKGLEYGEPARDFTVRMNKLAGRANTEVVDLFTDEGRIQ
jgi:hypothetical protein